MKSSSFAPLVIVGRDIRVPWRRGHRLCGMRDSAALSGSEEPGEPRSCWKRQGKETSLRNACGRCACVSPAGVAFTISRRCVLCSRHSRRVSHRGGHRPPAQMRRLHAPACCVPAASVCSCEPKRGKSTGVSALGDSHAGTIV
eukprot:6178793-Pleurochrysis_carterae.AAC.3